MLTLGPLSLLAPWTLLGLAVLPALWWLLRVTPPAPKRIVFPPLRLLAGLRPRDETAARAPWWLLALRLVLAGLVILALARPVLDAVRALPGTGPVIVVIDNGWAAAHDWPARRAALAEILDAAGQAERPIALVSTAPAPPGAPPSGIALITTAEARERAEALRPNPWPTDRARTAQRLRESPALSNLNGATALWLSDGLGADADSLTKALERLGGVMIYRPASGQPVHLLRPPKAEGETLALDVLRAETGIPEILRVRAFDEDGNLLARPEATFAPDARETQLRLTLPSEQRNRLARLEIGGEHTAGAVVLADERWRRRPVGLVTATQDAEAQPLLSPFHYIEKALSPAAEVRRDTAADLLDRALAVLVLTDESIVTPEERAAIGRWVENGGFLMRFAGPLLAARPPEPDDNALLPVPLRIGDRNLGGTLTWQEPARIAPFAENSPFRGLDIPEDIRIRRQVLAQPVPDLDSWTWARLADGTPLVTAETRGRGRIVLMHVPADPAWSNLPFSGLFVEMLQRLLGQARGVAAADENAPLPPLEILDGFGRLGPVPAGVKALPPPPDDTVIPGPGHPPGFYGHAEARRALNLGASVEMSPFPTPPPGIETRDYQTTPATEFKPALLLLAFVLALIDLGISLSLRGHIRARPAAATALAVALFTGTAQAQSIESLSGEAFAVAATRETRLAFVETGDAKVDAISKAGLAGLAAMVNRRTAAELGAPVGIDVEIDELAFWPLLYWPVIDRPPPSAEAAARIRAYLADGGIILFDTRDPQGGPSLRALRALAERLDLPPLEPVPEDHVLGRAYYLLDDFPGRWIGGQLWIERPGERINDGVPPVIAGSHDWAAAWAVDDAQIPLFPTVPGAERQREMAFRFGINLVMVALTGNYKADQVHLRAILERLGL